ncbi:hypothetical protein [Lignipirellula cremea]|uniref:hypothetical protein n=1 Tax=Lignipirellula cremea TaxID=2528010 RepID=UPI0011A92524|nr:hypothetical protein [Lignipirellula cremea]
MKFGPYSEEVEQVVDFAKGSDLFAATPNPSAFGDALIVRDFAQAKSLAWEHVYGNDELLWSDIREREMSEVRAIAHTIADFSAYRDNLFPLLQKLTLCIKRKLDGNKTELLDDIAGDLYNCAFNRCVRGSGGSCFFESIFVVYRAGGWPCGWDGDYPHGRLAVFLPDSE